MNTKTHDYGPGIVLNDPAWIHPSALLYGKVRIGKGASIWPHVVARAEFYEIAIGEWTNIQDFTMIHVGAATGTHVGAHCSITHHCTIHGCSIGDNCLIGINSTIMDGCVIGNNCIVGGHSFLKEGTVIPDNSIVMGVPGKVTRTQNNYIRNRLNAFLYHHNALAYARGEHRLWDQPEFQEEMNRYMQQLAREYAALFEKE